MSSLYFPVSILNWVASVLFDKIFVPCHDEIAELVAVQRPNLMKVRGLMWSLDHSFSLLQTLYLSCLQSQDQVWQNKYSQEEKGSKLIDVEKEDQLSNLTKTV